jgi:hypothetical protein
MKNLGLKIQLDMLDFSFTMFQSSSTVILY